MVNNKKEQVKDTTPRINYKDYLIRTNEPDDLTKEKVTRAWVDLENRFGIKFTLKSGEFRPVNEWLDDLYLRFTPEEVSILISFIMEYGSILFADILKHRE